jgi:hypothetical protein
MQCFLKQKLPIDIKSKYSSVAFSLLSAFSTRGFFSGLEEHECGGKIYCVERHL